MVLAQGWGWFAMNTKLLVAVAAGLLATAPAQAVELITNGSFETGDFSGWTQVGDTSFSFVTDELAGGGPTDGVFHAAFGPVNELGGISQTFSTIAGQTYFLSFDLAYLGGTPNSLLLVWGGDVILIGNDVIELDYVTFSGFLLATSSSTELAFYFYSPPSYWLLDNVSVDGAVVPEPASWAMMIAGFGLVGMAARRRKAVRASA